MKSIILLFLSFLTLLSHAQIDNRPDILKDELMGKPSLVETKEFYLKSKFGETTEIPTFTEKSEYNNLGYLTSLNMQDFKNPNTRSAYDPFDTKSTKTVSKKYSASLIWPTDAIETSESFRGRGKWTTKNEIEDNKLLLSTKNGNLSKFEYDAMENCTSEEIYSGLYDLKEIRKYSYQKTNLTSIKVYTNQGEMYKTVDMTYDAKRNLIKHEERTLNSRTKSFDPTNVSEKAYDNKGNCVRINQLYSQGTSVNVTELYEYEYNSNNSIKKKSSFRSTARGKTIYEILEYRTYDDKGNWTEAVKSENLENGRMGPSFVYRREILY